MQRQRLLAGFNAFLGKIMRYTQKNQTKYYNFIKFRSVFTEYNRNSIHFIYESHTARVVVVYLSFQMNYRKVFPLKVCSGSG